MPNSYRPGPLLNTENTTELGAYILRELERISDALNERENQGFTAFYDEPPKDPKSGDRLIAYFNFGPPRQRGFHVWTGNNWRRIRTAPP